VDEIALFALSPEQFLSKFTGWETGCPSEYFKREFCYGDGLLSTNCTVKCLHCIQNSQDKATGNSGKSRVGKMMMFSLFETLKLFIESAMDFESESNERNGSALRALVLDKLGSSLESVVRCGPGQETLVCKT